MLAIKHGQSVRAYPLGSHGPRAIMDAVERQPVVVLLASDGHMGAAFVPEAAGRALSFHVVAGRFRDYETASTWDLGGRAGAGALVGETLTPIASRTSFWFALVAAEPGVSVNVDTLR